MPRSGISRLGLYLFTILELLGFVTTKGVAVMIPSSSTSPIRRQCPPLPKPLSTSILQCWRATNVVKKDLLDKMNVKTCSACFGMEPNMLLKDYGARLSSLTAKLKCLFSLQDEAVRKSGLDTNLVFITPVNLSNIATYVEEIIAKPEVCTNSLWVPARKCSDFMADSMDVTKLTDKEIVYRLGYQFTAELQNFLENLYLSNSSI
ncbi:hypothetical protein ACHWQZ_G001213 [Mnemiopsis leidyi]